MGFTRRIACMLGVSVRGPDGRPRHPAVVSRARWHLRVALVALAVAVLLPLFIVTPGSRERPTQATPQAVVQDRDPAGVIDPPALTQPAASPAAEPTPDLDPTDDILPSIGDPDAQERAVEVDPRPRHGAVGQARRPASSLDALPPLAGMLAPEPSVEPDEGSLSTAPSAGPLPAARPARPSARSVASGGPRIAIVVDDIGPARALSARAVALPGPLTMSFLPYAENLAPLIAAARTHGHQIFLHMPMQPVGRERPGPNALLDSMTTDELRRHLAWAIARVPGAVGMNNHMGSRLTTNERAMRAVMELLAQQGLVFVDSRTSPRSIAAAIAADAGLPHSARDVFIDHLPTAGFVRGQLAEVEAIARRSGSAIAIGHPLPVTLAALERWIPDAKSRGFSFVPVTTVIERRGCDGRSPAGRCGMLLTAGVPAGG